VGLNSNSWLPDLLPNCRLGWKRLLTLDDRLTVYDTAKIIAVKSFLVQAQVMDQPISEDRFLKTLLVLKQSSECQFRESLPKGKDEYG